MPYWVSELVNLALRWLHVVAAIFWIGQTALFTWLDTRLRVERDARGQELWMVHGGGFYRVEKLPWQVPQKVLHWFQWEAALTWTSGMLLFVWIYYRGGILVEADGPVALGPAIAISVGVLVAAWVVYDLLWATVFASRERLGAVVSFGLLMVLAWGLTQLFSGRGAYLQVGATLGTLMNNNVHMRILPAMRRAVGAAAAGREIDPEIAARTARAAQRSRHNTFMALPVVFLMISNHYPVTTYGHRLAWAILGAYAVVGFAARWLLNRWEARSATGGGGR
jgi:uncharacterized membrane protein